MYECTPSAVAKKFNNEMAEEVMYPIIIPVMSSMMLLLIRVEKNRISPMTTMEPIKAPTTIEKKLERVKEYGIDLSAVYERFRAK